MVTDCVTTLFCNFTVSFHPCIVKEYKTVLDQFGFYAVHSGFLDNGNWIPDFNRLLDSGNPDYLRSFNLPAIFSTYCLRGVNDTFTVFLTIFKEQRSVTMSKGPVIIYRRGEGWGRRGIWG